jgi:hypothetical protein
VVWEIDPNMMVEMKEPMRLPRYNTSLAMIKDRFIFALGGMVAKGKSTEQCEVYDVNTNVWH